MYWPTSLVAVIAVAGPLVHAHTALNEFFVNGVGRGAGTCIRMNTDGKVNMYIEDITSDDMACGYAGANVVGRTCPIKAGDTVAFQWRARPGELEDLRPIYDNHLGPCSIYMKRISTNEPSPDGSFPSSPAPAGNGWFKIMYDVKDDKGEWCTERMRVSKDGAIQVQIPTDLQSGYYLLRPELMSLTHARQGNPQIWAGCVQVYITGGTGTAQPPTIAIPGHVKPGDEAMTWNVLTDPAPPFPEIGGPVYEAAQDTVNRPKTKLINKVHKINSPDTRDLSLVSDSTRGNLKRSMRIARSSKSFLSYLERRQTPLDPFACPADTIMELGNACLPAYPTWTDTDEKAMPNCKAAQDKCFATGDKCFDITNPAVNNKEGHGCRVYREKCNEIKQACIDKVMSGPVDATKIITPPTVRLAGVAIERRDVAVHLGEVLEPLRRRVASAFVG